MFAPSPSFSDYLRNLVLRPIWLMSTPSWRPMRRSRKRVADFRCSSNAERRQGEGNSLCAKATDGSIEACRAAEAMVQADVMRFPAALQNCRLTLCELIPA